MLLTRRTSTLAAGGVPAESTSKRRRVSKTIQKAKVWKEILRLWCKLHHSSIEVCTHLSFVIFSGRKNETMIETVQTKANGLHSEIYHVFINGIQQDVVLKKFTPTNSEQLLPLLECHMQIYASKHGLAPPVLTFNNFAMISVKCQKHIQEKYLQDDVMWNRTQPKKTRKILNTLNTALGPSALQIKEFALKMYTKIGMYNMDPNMDNYMYLNNVLVQIDFGQNRFDSLIHLRKSFQTQLNFKRNTKLTQVLLESHPPVCPHNFYWYEKFLAMNFNKHAVQDINIWTEEQWKIYIDTLHEKRNECIQILNDSHQ